MAEAPPQGRLTQEVPATGEAFHLLAALPGARIEHIVSSAEADDGEQTGQSDEWVLVLRGSAELEIAGSTYELHAGDWVLLPAGLRHRVVRTDAGTHWLAVHSAKT